MTTQHFVLETDLDGAAALSMATELELSRDAIISAAWPHFDFPETSRTEAFALSDEAEFRRLFGPNVGGMFRPGVYGTFFLMGPSSRWSSVGPGGSTNSAIRHEMAHRLAAFVYPVSTPRWFTEGMATFLETIRMTPDGASVLIGEPNREHLSSVRRGEMATLQRALEWSEDNNEMSASEVATLYAKSWLFFFWLYHVNGELFDRYQEALADGTEPTAAWLATFPALDLSKLDPTLSQYARDGRFLVGTYPLRISKMVAREQLMTPSDIHVARAKLAFRARVDGAAGLEEGKEQVARALLLDSTHVQALRLDTWSPLEKRLEGARRALAAHPDDGWAYVLLSDVLNFTAPDSDEQERLRRRAVALLPNEPEVLSLLSFTLLRRNKAGESLPLARRAANAAPENAAIADIYALVLLANGHCSAAMTSARRALILARDATRTVRERAARDLSTITAACRS